MKKLQKALKADLTLILSRFQQTESVRFEVFSRIWTELDFNRVFSSLGKHESRSFARLALDTAYDFLLPPFTFQIRVGGVYLLYALFHCQSATPPEQIRVALKDWEELMKFEKDSVEAQHFDVVFVLRKLLHHKAFFFTAMPQMLSFQRKKVPHCPQLRDSFVEKPSAPQTLIHHDLLEELSNVHGLYEGLKSSICPGSESESGLNLTQQNLVQGLKETVLGFYNWQQSKFEDRSEAEAGEGTSAQIQSSRRADLLALIKSQAYGEAPEVSKSRRHRAVEMDLETKPDLKLRKETRYEKHRRKTLRFRTITSSSTVTGEVWKDLLSVTDTRRLPVLRSDDKSPQSFTKFSWKMEND